MKPGAEPISDEHITERGRAARPGSGVYPASPASVAAHGRLGAPPEHSADAWGRCSSTYDVFSEAITARFADDAARLVRLGSGTRVLDVATGTGAFAFAAALRGAEVVATDFSPDMVRELSEKCRRRGFSRVRTAVMDGESLELDSSSFDVAASLFGLMFFPNPTRGLMELLRVLRPGGRAVIATWAPPARVEMMRLLGEAAMMAMVDLNAPPEPACWTAMSRPEMLRKQLAGLGFAHVHVMEVTHVCTFETAEAYAKLLPAATPSAAAAFEGLSEEERVRFEQALIDGFRERQGEGPYAMTCEALITVATKSG